MRDKELGRANYRAQQVPGAVVIFAEGWHPTSGYQDFFEQSPLDIFPPQFILWQIPPKGIVAQQLTPFVIWVMFGATETIETVHVSDADGDHEIKVEQTPDVAVTHAQRKWVRGNVIAGSATAARTASTQESAASESAAASVPLTTLRLGEEGPITTFMLGEEDPVTTRAIGEEDVMTTLMVGEEDPPLTTLRFGEEGPVTTRAIGEEDPPWTTLRVGEEGVTTMMVGEEEGNIGNPTTGNPFGGY